jgi:gas vesicle protein
MEYNEETEAMERYSDSERAETARLIFTGLGIGLLAGLAIGILIAPKTGRDTRTHLKEIAGDFTKKAKDLASTFGDKVTTTKDALKRGADAVKETYKSTGKEAE